MTVEPGPLHGVNQEMTRPEFNAPIFHGSIATIWKLKFRHLN